MTALRLSPLLALALACGACQSNTCPSPGKGPIASFSASPSADLDEAEAWLSMPHPSDHRRDDTGKPDWTDFPDPNRVDLLDDYLDIIADLDGHGLSSPIFIRFDAPLDSNAIPLQPAPTRTSSDRIQLVDITPSSPEYGRRRPVRWQWWNDAQTYVPNQTLAVAPAWGFPLRESTIYALILTKNLTGEDGAPIQTPGLLTALLEGENEDSCENTAVPSDWLDAYSPLRAFLDSDSDLKERIGAATVFTTQSLSDDLEAIRATLQEDGPTYTPNTWKTLGENGETWEAKSYKWTSRSTVDFFLLEGRLTVPNYQVGSIPYDRNGQLNIVEGIPTPVAQENIRFTLTIPSTPPPGDAECFPIIEYAHGTTGSAYSMVDETSGRLAARGLAAISIDMPLHGERDGGRTFDKNAASFNFINPDSARSMFRQAAIDTFSLTAFINNGLTIEASSSPTGEAICFDTTKIGYFGHSQGGLSGSIAAAYENDISAWVISGAGGGLGITVQERKDFADFEELVKFLLQIPEEEELTELHPVHSVIQTAVEITDPLNYARLWQAAHSDAGTIGPHLLITSGCLDEQTPFRSSNALALAASVPLLEPVAVEIPEYQWLGLPYASAPLAANSSSGATQGYLQWCGAITSAHLSNHFVIFNRPEAIHASMRFLESWAYEDAVIIERVEDADVR